MQYMQNPSCQLRNDRSIITNGAAIGLVVLDGGDGLVVAAGARLRAHAHHLHLHAFVTSGGKMEVL